MDLHNKNLLKKNIIRRVKFKIKYFVKKFLYEISMRFLIKIIIKKKLACIQIGAGAGNLDPRTSDEGFHKVIRNVFRHYKPKIHIYEPNPKNQLALKKSWIKYSNHVEVFQEGVSLSNEFEKIKFYFHPLDEPHYQVCSIQKDHVLKHFKGSSVSDLKTFVCDCIPVDRLFERIIDENNSDIFIAIDAEGIDYVLVKKLLNSVHINKYLIISFEKLHLNKEEYREIIELANLKGFVLAGFGVDPLFYDRLLVKKKIIKNNLILKIIR